MQSDHVGRRTGRRFVFGLTAAGAGAILLGFVGVANPGAQDKPTGRVEVCATETCHPTIVQRRVKHGPVAQLQCMTCHEYAVPEEHLFRLTTPKDQLCASCHTLQNEAVVHDPVVQNDCTGCHDPHGSDFQMLLVADPARGLCMNCHDQDYSEKAFVHGPVAAGACVVCHASHSSNQEFLLTDSPTRLCADCHSEMFPTGAAARRQHQPMEDGCTTCHDPHASDVKFQLHESSPSLCYSCHDGMEQTMDTAVVLHGPAGSTGGCVTCHSPHFSQLPRLQKVAQPELCLDCHNTELKAGDGRTLTNMVALLTDNPNHHGPIKEGNCTGCHQPHASEHFRLLIEEYPPEFYAPFDFKRYALCFSCHMKELVQDESGTGLTRFRDGDRNLHWLHVNQGKGRTCRACHEVHASRRPTHIREAVPFGNSGWMLEIRFDKTEDGGSCAPGCHKAKAYSRDRQILPGTN